MTSKTIFYVFWHEESENRIHFYPSRLDFAVLKMAILGIFEKIWQIARGDRASSGIYILNFRASGNIWHHILSLDTYIWKICTICHQQSEAIIRKNSPFMMQNCKFANICVIRARFCTLFLSLYIEYNKTSSYQIHFFLYTDLSP